MLCVEFLIFELFEFILIAPQCTHCGYGGGGQDGDGGGAFGGWATCSWVVLTEPSHLLWGSAGCGRTTWG